MKCPHCKGTGEIGPDRPAPAVGESETSRTIDDATPAELAACTGRGVMGYLDGLSVAELREIVAFMETMVIDHG